jgi:hypothetical protein
MQHYKIGKEKEKNSKSTKRSEDLGGFQVLIPGY